MTRCLGLYVENNIIKYAKISKEHEKVELESFGVKIDDNIHNAIEQIIAETNSDKIPISINLLDENYTYASLSSLLKTKDLEKAVATEFDFFCKETKKIANGTEYRYLLTQDNAKEDKVTSLYAYVDKTNIVSRTQLLGKYKVKNLTPLPISISNLNKYNTKNSVIINIEKNTSVTFMIKNKVAKVELINIGMKDILDKIAAKEKSYAKAYEICKSATIYTVNNDEIQIDENDYMDDIMPTLYKIILEVQKIISGSNLPVEKIYITGLATAINNIDLYFQDNFTEEKCEILKPFFINKSSRKVNIRDYIEVNSAIALALEGVGLGNKDMNFKKNENGDIIKGIEKINLKIDLKNDFKSELDKTETKMLGFSFGLLIIFIIYSILSQTTLNSINKKNEEVQNFISDTRQEIWTVVENTRRINAKSEQYKKLLDKLDQAATIQSASYARKNAVPNFLTEVMYNIPKDVQLISIENTTDKTINIQARSKEYEQLGYFIAKIKNERILTNVTSTSGVKQGEYVVITITGDLSY